MAILLLMLLSQFPLTSTGTSTHAEDSTVIHLPSLVSWHGNADIRFRDEASKFWQGELVRQEKMNYWSGYIANPNAWKQLWTTWRKDEVPDVNFVECVVIVSIESDSLAVQSINSLDQNGELKHDAQTKGSRKSNNENVFRYQMSLISKHGVKLIAGKRIAGSGQVEILLAEWVTTNERFLFVLKDDGHWNFAKQNYPRGSREWVTLNKGRLSYDQLDLWLLELESLEIRRLPSFTGNRQADKGEMHFRLWNQRKHDWKNIAIESNQAKTIHQKIMKLTERSK